MTSSYPCIHDFGYFSSPPFLTLSLHVLTAISLPIYCLGVYCILFKTPELMKSVKWYLLNLHFWAISMDYILGVLATPYVLFPAVAWIPYGLFEWLGVPRWIQSASMTLGFCGIGISSVSTYENRFYILCEFPWKPQWTVLRWIWLFLHYSGCTIAIIYSVLQIPEQEAAKQHVFGTLPCFPEYVYQADVFVLSSSPAILFVYATFGGGIAAFECLFFIFYLITNAIKQLKNHTISMATLKMQRTFLTALTLQTCTQVGMLVVPLLLVEFSMLFDYRDQTMINIGTIFVAAHGMMSTIVMLIVHRPYRVACLEIMGRNDKRPGPKVSIDNSQGGRRRRSTLATTAWQT